MSDKSDSDNIDQVLNDTDNDTNDVSNNDQNDILDINADTPTMNKQLANHMDQVNKSKEKSSDPNSNQPKKVCTIDKNLLKELIVEWLALDDQIKTYRDAMKDMADEKKQFEAQILEVMGALEQETIITDKGNISRNVKESKAPLTPELIKATLSEILKCTQTADTYTNQIMEKRTIKETVSLKRATTEKKQKGKKNNNPNQTAKKKQSRKKNNQEPTDV